MNAVSTKEWNDAPRRCRLSDAALAMAKELGLAPHSLVKTFPTATNHGKPRSKSGCAASTEKKFRYRRISAPPPAYRPKIAAHPPDPASHLVSEIDAAREVLFPRLADGELDEDAFLAAVDRVE